ncbi:MAG: hypothetical protein ACRENO_08190 [Thermodesulfobacteriota bacterium]
MFGLKKNSIYTLAVLIFIAGLISFFFTVKHSFKGLGSTLQKFEVPGEIDFKISKDGTYSIYHEYITKFNGIKVNNTDLDINSINLKLTKLRDDKQVDLSKPESIKKYSYLGRKGVKLFQFENKGINEYKLSSYLKDIQKPINYSLTLENGFELKRLIGIVVSQAVLLFPILISLFLFIRTYIKND